MLILHLLVVHQLIDHKLFQQLYQTPNAVHHVPIPVFHLVPNRLYLRNRRLLIFSHRHCAHLHLKELFDSVLVAAAAAVAVAVFVVACKSDVVLLFSVVLVVSHGFAVFVAVVA